MTHPYPDTAENVRLHLIHVHEKFVANELRTKEALFMLHEALHAVSTADMELERDA